MIQVLPLLAALVFQTAPKDIKVEGAVAKPGKWTVERIATDLQADLKPIEYDLKGKHHTAKGVPLRRLIEVSTPRFDEKIKNHKIRFAVLAVGRDGYAATFSWGELVSDYGKTDAWVITEEDGAPLSADAAPLSLVVPSDTKPSRWVHGLAKIKVVDLRP